MDENTNKDVPEKKDTARIHKITKEVVEVVRTMLSHQCETVTQVNKKVKGTATL